jgi:hypothetical protein
VTTASPDKAPMRATLLLIVSAVATFAAVGIYASVVYDGSPDGIAATLGGISGYFAIALLIGFLVNKRRFSKNLISICLLIAIGIFWASKSSVFTDALDAKESKSLLAQAKTPDDIIRLSKEHPKSRFLAFIADLMAVRLEGDKKSAEIIAPLAAYDFSCLEKVTQRNRQSLVGCRDYFVRMAGTISEVKERYESYTALRKEELRKLLANLSERYRFSDASVMRGAERGVAAGVRNTEKFSKEYLNSLEKLNKACVDWLHLTNLVPAACFFH